MNTKTLSVFKDLDAKLLAATTGGDSSNKLFYHLGQGARKVWDASQKAWKTIFN